MSKKTVFKIIFFISLIIFILCAIWLIRLLKPQVNDYSKYDNDVSHTRNPESENAGLPDNPKDFKKLQKDNPDVYAWIYIPDTNVDYPVVQSSADKDDDFYLNHNIHKNYEFAGMIYSHRLNSKDFHDPVTVLYGHNMLNGSMFATLHKFKDSDFFEKHDKFYVYTPGHILTYSVLSAFVYNDRHILNTFDFSKRRDLKEYVATIKNPKSIISNVRKGVKCTTRDHILTLSTCTSVDTQRYLVQGVLKNDQITK